MKDLKKYGLTYLAQLPKERYFQLFIDGRLHHQGVSGFEKKEPGCMQAFYRAFSYAVHHIDEPLTPTWLHRIHKRASTGVVGDFGNLEPGRFRNISMDRFTADLNRITYPGVMSLRKDSRYRFLFEDDDHPACLVIENEAGKAMDVINSAEATVSNHLKASIHTQLTAAYIPPFHTDKEVEDAANLLIERYQTEINAAKNFDQTLKAIVLLARSFELLHPYEDGNGRVFVNVMLNTLLMKNGFPPATFYEPNIFDLYHDDELVNAVKEAMLHTLYCIDNPGKPLYCYTPIAADDISQKQYKRIIKEIDAKQSHSFRKHNRELRQYLENSLDDEYALHRACVLGDVATIRKLLTREALTLPAPLTAPPLYKGLAPLHIACKMGHVDVVRMILDEMPALSVKRDAYERTPLFYAIAHKRNDIIDLFLSRDYPLIESDEDFFSIFACAARYGTVDLFTKLLPPDFVQFDRILDLCMEGNNLAVAKWIIENKKINLKAMIDTKWYVYCIANGIEYKSFDVIHCLITEAHKDTRTSFAEIAQRYFDEPTEEIFQNKDVINLLLDTCDFSRGIDVYEVPLNVWLDAIASSDLRDDTVPLRMFSLIPDIANFGDVGSLMTTAYRVRKPSLVHYLVDEKHCDPNLLGQGGKNLLHIAAARDDVKMIDYLVLSHQVDINKTTLAQPKYNSLSLFEGDANSKPAYSALDLAVKQGNIKAAKALLNYGAKMSNNTEKYLEKCRKNADEMRVLLRTAPAKVRAGM